MSNRTLDQLSAMAELRASHLAQIEVLTAPGLSDWERVKRFICAAQFCGHGLQRRLGQDHAECLLRCGLSPAAAIWYVSGYTPKSLFAHLPGCYCPVMEGLSGVPRIIPDDWRPDRDQLEVFSRIQIERRFPDVVE